MAQPGYSNIVHMETAEAKISEAKLLSGAPARSRLFEAIVIAVEAFRLAEIDCATSHLCRDELYDDQILFAHTVRCIARTCKASDLEAQLRLLPAYSTDVSVGS